MGYFPAVVWHYFYSWAVGQQINGRTGGDQRCLSAQHILDPHRQGRPVGLRQIEMCPQIQKRVLPYGSADAGRLHQPKGKIFFSGLAVTGLGAPNEHGATLRSEIGKNQPKSTKNQILWHYKNQPQKKWRISAISSSGTGQNPPK